MVDIKGISKKEKIIAAAMDVFAQKGYYAARPRDIASTAQVSVGLLYHYFASKKDIFRAVFQFMQELLRQDCERVLQNLKWKSVGEPIFSLTKVIISNIKEKPHYVNFWMMEKEIYDLFGTEKKEVVLGFKKPLMEFFAKIGVERKESKLLFLAGIYLQIIKQRLTYHIFFSDTLNNLEIGKESKLVTDFFLGGFQNVQEQI